MLIWFYKGPVLQRLQVLNGHRAVLRKSLFFLQALWRSCPEQAPHPSRHRVRAMPLSPGEAVPVCVTGLLAQA